MRIVLDQEFNIDELAYSIEASNTPEDIIKLIRSLDSYVADWDFTKEIALMFARELISGELDPNDYKWINVEELEKV